MKTLDNQNLAPIQAEKAEENIPVFEDIDFGNLNWKDLNIKSIYNSNFNIDVSGFSREIIFKGQNLFLGGLKKIIYTKTDKLSREEFNFIISLQKSKVKFSNDPFDKLMLYTSGPKINFNLSVSYPRNNFHASRAHAVTDILKEDITGELPKEMAEMIYEKIFEYIQTLANERQLAIVHEITKYTGLSNTPMSEERWHQIFGPILHKHNYKATKVNIEDIEGLWEKKYTPEE